MNVQLKKFLETTLEHTIYGMAEKFLVNAPSNNQEMDQMHKEQMSEYIKNKVAQIITDLEQQGFNQLTDFQEKPQMMIEIVDKIEEEMMEDAKKSL